MIIIGIDGADPEIIEELHEAGRLENISRVIEEGSFSRMRSTHVPITPAAWTSMLTGKNPGKHGVFGFSKIEKGESKLVSETNRTRTFLDVLDQRTGMANIPATYPVTERHEFELSGMMTPDLRSEKAVHPEEVRSIAEEEGYEIDLTKTYTGDNEEELLEELEKHIEAKTKVFQRLKQDFETDTCFFTYMAIDWASHWFWRHMDESHPDFEDTEFRDALKELYVKLDSEIGELIEDEDNVVIVSDHGFTSYERSLNLNPVFLEEDLIQIKGSLRSQLRYKLYRKGITLEKAYDLAKKIGLGDIASEAAQTPETTVLDRLKDLLFLGFKDLDWERTQAYSASDFGPVYLEEDSEEVREKVTSVLQQLEDRGEKVVEEYFFSEEIYEGSHADEAPDIVYYPRDWKYHSTRFYEFGTAEVISDPKDNKSGHHHPEGVMLASGPIFEQRSDRAEISIMDLAPTLIHGFERPVPEDMDGRVADELLKTDTEPSRSEELDSISL